MIANVAKTDGNVGNVNPRDAGEGLTLNGNTLSVTKPFTDEDETKLDGVETNAQKNPKHIVFFRSIDSDPDSIPAGAIGFIKSDNSQWQSGSTNDISAIEINSSQFSLLQNPQLPSATPSTTGWHSLPQDIVDNKGSTIWDFYNLGSSVVVPGVPTFRLQAESIAKNNDGNYVLQNLHVLKGWDHSGSAGVNWQVVGVFAPPTGADSVIGLLDKLKLPDDIVYKEQLVGKETDRYASYTNAFIAEGYRSGAWSLFTTATGPPTDADAVRQPDIADRDTNGIVAFAAKLRTDRDPNNLQFAIPNIATDYVSGQVLYVSIWNDKSAHLKITLTSGGTLVGTGNSAYIWATATWDEVNELPDVANEGDYMLIAENEPTDLPIEIPANDVLNAPWVKPTGTELTDSQIEIDTKLLTKEGDTVEAGEFVEWHDEHHVGKFEITGLVYNTSNALNGFDDNDVNFNVNSLNNTKGILYYKYPNNAAKNSLKSKIVVGKSIELKLTDSIKVVGRIESTPADLNGRLSFNLNEVVSTGTRTNNHAASIILDSKIPSREQLSQVALKENLADPEDGDVGKLIKVNAEKEFEYANPYSVPAITTITSLATEQAPDEWTDILTNVDANDIIEVACVYEAGNNNWGTGQARFRFGFLSTSLKTWFPRPADSGARFNLRRNGTTLQAQTAGGLSGESFELYINKR